jgi:hypothetical protein
MNKVEIQLSKKKIGLLLIGAIVFVLLGMLFLLTPDNFISIIIRNPQTIRVVGIAAVLFFGAVGVFVLRKLFDKSIGLAIDENGITDNSNASSVGLIEWTDIVGIKTKQVMSTKFLLILINNPDKYLERVNGFKRKLMQGNMKMYGTPLSITSNTLRYNFDDLERLVKERLIEKQEKLPNRLYEV